MIAYTFLVVLTLVVAYFEARQDASDIKKHVRIDHAAQLWERARLLGVVVFCTIVGSCWENGEVKWEWRALFFLPICWAVFTVAFRLLLNWFRGLDYRYVSNSNVYDRIWLRIAEYTRARMWADRDTIDFAAKAYHDPKAFLPEALKHWRHRAGTLAYLFELSILALSTWGYIHYQ